MRIVACIICLTICSDILGQSEFEKQLNLILKDSTNRFRSFKAGLKYQSVDDSVFYSTFNLEGTVENNVFISNEQSTIIADHYMADIAKSISEKEGRKMSDKWKNRILSIVGNDFQISKIDSKKYPSSYGWSFERGYFVITIAYIKRKTKVESLLLLHISYLHLRE